MGRGFEFEAATTGVVTVEPTPAQAERLQTSTGFTMAMFLRRGVSGSDMTLMAKLRRTEDEFSYWIGVDATSRALEVWRSATERVLSVPLSFAAGEWGHVAVTWDSVRFRVYMDGVEVGTAEAALGFDDSAVLIGAWARAGAAFEPWTGSLDEIRLYDEALRSEDVAALARCSGS